MSSPKRNDFKQVCPAVRWAKGPVWILTDQSGTALLVALGIMIMISLIGIAAITTTSIDMDISGSEKRSTQSLYLAEAGLERTVYEYIWPSFNDENICPMTNLFGWIGSLAGDTIYQEVEVSGQGRYTVMVTSVSDPGAVSPYIECREITIESHGISSGGSENTTVVGVLRFGIYPSGVYDYSYFMNHFGWWAGFPSGRAVSNGNMRANGHFDLLSAYLTGNGNPRYNPIDGEAIDNGGIYAGGYVMGSGYQGMAQYAENRHSYAGVNQGELDPAYVEMPNLNDAGDVDNDGNVQELNPYYLMLAKGELGISAGRAGQDTNGDGILQDAEVIIDGCYGDDAGETGSVVLVGTSSNPIIVDGPVVVTDNLVVKGDITGQGACYVGRNTYLAGTVTYVDPPSERPTFNYGLETPEEYKARLNTWLEANEDKDIISFQTRESVVIGNHTSSTWKHYITDSGGWLRDYRNDGCEDVGTDRVFGDMDNQSSPYGSSEKERDGYWTVELYNESTGERQVTDLQIAGGGVSVPTGWRVVPGSGEDVDGDGDYDDPYNYSDDINFEVSFNSTNFHNMPGGISQYSDLAGLTIGGVDGTVYTNHACAGWFADNSEVNGALVARNESLIVNGSYLTMNHDERLTGSGGTVSSYGIYLPRVKGVTSVSWEEK
jgi:hypothetical protein